VNDSTLTMLLFWAVTLCGLSGRYLRFRDVSIFKGWRQSPGHYHLHRRENLKYHRFLVPSINCCEFKALQQTSCASQDSTLFTI